MRGLKFSKFKELGKKVFWITVGWLIFSNLQFLYDYAVLLHYKCSPENYNIYTFFAANQIVGLAGGIIGGIFIVGVMNKWLRQKAYGLALLYIFLSFVFMVLFVAIFTSSFINSQKLGLPFYSDEVLAEVSKYIFSLDFIRNAIIWLFVVVFTLILLLVSDKYGPGVFGAFLLGKYFHPKREERIFMFLDIKSSTTIAEKLGEEKYFNFVKDFYTHATDGIIYSKGEIYQYVGDEIVVSWKMDNGISNANCIKCYFDIKESINQRESYYEEQYGIFPEFKAGFHYGNVMAGEIGIVKRDIAFSGDVLNTTARIQSKCNELGAKLLLSKYLLDKLSLPPHAYQPQKIGEILLRGKQQKIILYTLD